MISQVSLSAITLDARAQSRAGLNDAVVAEYAEAMSAGVDFPALVVFWDGATHWLSEGFHRYAAATQSQQAKLLCDVREGDLRAAILHSVGANASHGLRRTNEDKRRAVALLIEDEEWSAWSDNEIARRCAVSPTFVGGIRRSLSTVDSEPRTYTTRHGTVATMNTSAIGKRPIAEGPETGSDVLADVANSPAGNGADQPVAEQELTPDQADETGGGFEGGCSAGKRGDNLPLGGASSIRGNDSPQVVTAGETAPSNIVALSARQTAVPAFADLDCQNEAEEAAEAVRDLPDIDLESVEGRAHAVNGSLSTIAMIEITGREYWSVFNRDPARQTYADWLRIAHSKLSNILKEIDHVGNEVGGSSKDNRRSRRAS